MELMDAPATAKFLTVPIGTLNSWLTTKVIDRDRVSILLGRRRLFIKEKLVQFLEEQMKEQAKRVPA